MTRITADSMKCASVNGCAFTAVVFISGKGAAPEEEAHETLPAAQSGSTFGSTPKTQITSE